MIAAVLLSAHVGLVAYVEDFLAHVRTSWRESAVALVPLVVEVSEAHGVDPWITAVVISCESSWRVGVVARSAHQERGLMQVHGKAARGYDLSTARGQIEAGVARLRQALDACETLEGSMSHYMTSGSCRVLRQGKRRARLIRAAKKEYEK